MLRRRRARAAGPPIEELTGRWREPVARAVAARDRYREVVARTPGGPLRARLEELSAQLDLGVEQAWRTAARAQETERTLAGIALDSVGARLKDARRRAARLPPGSAERASADAEVALLAEQFSSLNRLHNGLDATADELRRVELRLETALARAAELALGTNPQADAALDAVLADLGALRAALEELGR
ncbi:MAG: hypothetical protein KatS3mg009_2011 [Acidimicrobiia bacterium]|nr:MAG: hypothetical protein KatS3mg009_2011 [Acidimicrobiia bacterium]